MLRGALKTVGEWALLALVVAVFMLGGVVAAVLMWFAFRIVYWFMFLA